MSTSPVIIITGASSGIGAATARLFGREGYRVVLAARRAERLQPLAQEIRGAGGDALPVRVDTTRLDQIQNLVTTTLDEFGQIDVLFNNAGFGRLGWLEELDPVEDIERQIQTNVLGVIQTTRAVLPHMIQQRSGHIINMSSISGLIVPSTYSVYAASKFAIRGFTEGLRRDVAGMGIHVSGLYPGGVAGTEFGQHTGVESGTSFHTPKFLKLTAEKVADAVLRLDRHPRRMVVIPWPMLTVVWINILAPGLVDWGIVWRYTRRRL
ncbi:MAG: SDR family oxidoreductase [Chloroflexota bacterium]